MNDEIDESQDSEDSGGITKWSVDFILKHIRAILSTVVIGLLFVLFVVSNTVTGTICIVITKKILEAKYQKVEGFSPTNRYTNPLYYLGKGDYSMKSDSGVPVYLRLDATFELDSRNVIDEVREKDARLKSIVREIFTNKRISDFNSKTGMQHARRLMLESINKILVSGKITNIYFTDYRFLWVDEQYQ
ncbi:MAG: flagellar basal body-associated FliL family protein [Candidatus Auribacterota bacterium]|nr:flagellar basal body-associated FliL family protein [Candidatus Auribacterota bacterium]